jgi:protein TonB
VNRSQTTSLLVSLAAHGVAGAVVFTCLTSRSVEVPIETPVVLEMVVMEPDVAPAPLPAAAVASLPPPSVLAQKQTFAELASPPAAAILASVGFETRSAIASTPVVLQESRAEILPGAAHLGASLSSLPPLDFGPLSIGPVGDSPRPSAAPSGSAGSTEGGGLLAYRLNPAPAYPAAAKRKGIQGLVLLRVEVDEGGEPLKVEVAETSGHALLDAAALDAVRRWRFEPARRSGQPVKGHAQVPIRFKIES